MFFVLCRADSERAPPESGDQRQCKETQDYGAALVPHSSLRSPPQGVIGAFSRYAVEVLAEHPKANKYRSD
jgi:hypothetical protein